MQYQNNTQIKEQQRIWILSILLFLFNPLIGILFLSYLCWKQQYNNLILIGLLIGIYCGLLNTTKILESDIAEYYQYFIDVPNHDFLSYIFSFNKEPLYYSCTYIGYYLFNANWNLFFISFTTINYLLLTLSIVKTAEALNIPKGTTLVGLFFMFLFFQEFSSIGHMVRQCLAESVVVLFFVLWYIQKKKKLWLALCAIAIHTSSLPIIAVGFIPVLYKKPTWKYFIISIFAFCLLIFVLYQFLPIFEEMAFTDRITGIIQDTEHLTGTDYWQEKVGLNLPSKILLTLNIFMVLSLYYSSLKHHHVWLPFVNIHSLFIIFIIICQVQEFNYLLMRYFFYLYAFQNITLLIFISLHKKIFGTITKAAFVFFLFIYFFYYLGHNVFTYLPIEGALLYPALTYFFI